jgi:hypothetical protein
LWLVQLELFLWIFQSIFASSIVMGSVRFADVAYQTR